MSSNAGGFVKLFLLEEKIGRYWILGSINVRLGSQWRSLAEGDECLHWLKIWHIYLYRYFNCH